MVSKDSPLLIVSWSVFPQQVAMSVLVHNMACHLGDHCVVVGEKPSDTKEWGSVNYPLYHIDPYVIPIQRGRQYSKWLSFRRSLKQLKSIIAKHNCCAILAAFPDEYYTNLARKASLHFDIPFYPWFHNTYLENRSGGLLRLARYLQPKFFKDANLVLSISDGLTSYYRREYENTNFSTLLHAFNIPHVDHQHYSLKGKEKITFAYTGSFNESCRDAAVRLAKAILSQPNYELHIFGKKNAQQFEKYGINIDQTVVYGFLPDEEFNAKLRACDIMLVPHGFTGARSEVEYNTIFPTRTIPLLYTDRPLLVHSPAEAEYTKWCISNNISYVVTSRSQDDIISQVDEIINDEKLTNQRIEAALRISKKYDVLQVINSLLAKII